MLYKMYRPYIADLTLTDSRYLIVDTATVGSRAIFVLCSQGKSMPRIHVLDVVFGGVSVLVGLFRKDMYKIK